MDDFPFADITDLELQNIFETGYDKLKNIINNSKLPKHINQLIPYFANSMTGFLSLCSSFPRAKFPQEVYRTIESWGDTHKRSVYLKSIN